MCRGGAPKGGAPKGRVGLRRVGGPKFLSLGGPFVEFWWCLKRQDPNVRKAAGVHATAREPKRVHLSVRALQTPPKFNEKTPREIKKSENGVDRGKKAKLWGPGGGVRGSDAGGLASGGEGPNQQHTTTQHNNNMKMDWPKLDWPKSATTVLQ